MQVNNQQSIQGYLVTLAVAMCLNILLLPGGLNSLNPDWVLLVLIYWTLAIPERIGVFNAWAVGIFLDVLTGRLLGQHALAYALISYACLKLHKRLRQYPLPQQSLFIFCCLLLSKMLVFWIESIQGTTSISYGFWMPVLMGTLLWPVMHSVLRYIRLFGHIG